MIVILSRRVIASKYVWVCFWELKTVNVLILDANSAVLWGPSYPTLPAVCPAPSGQWLCSPAELVQASLNLLPVSKMGVIIPQRINLCVHIR